MLTLHPRVVVAHAAEDGGGGHDEGRACYFVVVACVSLLLFVVLAAATGSVARACAITAAAALLLGLAGWAAPAWDGAPAAAGLHQVGVGSAPVRLVVHRRCACGLADAAVGALPAFAYEPPPPTAAKGGDGGSVLLCAVCLEDVRAGEVVRQLPACRHLFHADCVDAWLRAHRTCPLCCCDLSPRSLTAKAAAVESAADALPPG